MLVDALTVAYLACFQLSAWPAIRRVWARRSAADLSVWREWLLIAGCGGQLAVMLLTDADWRVVMSPVVSLISVAVLLAAIVGVEKGRLCASSLPPSSSS